MAMMIQKFHRLIQSRVLWMAFLILVCVAFVGLYTPGARQNRRRIAAAAEGELHGKPVSQETFRRNYLHAYLRLALRTLRPPTITDEVDGYLRELAWRRMAALDVAREMGISASNEEVVQRIQQDRLFTTEGGQFNQAQYNAFVQRFLAPLGVSEVLFEEHVRQELVLDKLRAMVAQSALIPPREIKRRFRMLKDKFIIQYALFTEDDLKEEVEVTPEEAKAYFEEHAEAFRVPEMADVSFVQFDVADFLPRVTAPTEEEAREYYDAHPEEFTGLAPENDAEEAGTTNAMVRVTESFEEARDMIVEKLTWQAARSLAAEKATDFVVALTPDRTGTAPSFEEAAAKFGKEIITVGPLSEEDVLPGTGAGAHFNQVALSLEDDPEQYFSDAVIGDDAVYVLKLNKRIPSRIPAFEEVETEVLARAREDARQEQLAQKAMEIQRAAQEAVAEGKTFASVLGSYGLVPKRTEEFTAASGLEDVPYSNIILRGIMARNAGEVTDPLPTPDGVLICYVESREPGDPSEYAALKDQIQNTLRQREGSLLYDQWEQQLLKEASFKDRRDQEVPAAEEGGAATPAASAGKS